MRNVAAYKWLYHRPVEDLEREAKILAATVERATVLGLNRDWVTEVVVAQMTAAKHIQSRWFTEWARTIGPTEAPDLAIDLRPKISALTDVLIQHLLIIKKAPLSAQDRNELMETPAELANDSAAWQIAIGPLLKQNSGFP